MTQQPGSGGKVSNFGQLRAHVHARTSWVSPKYGRTRIVVPGTNPMTRSPGGRFILSMSYAEPDPEG